MTITDKMRQRALEREEEAAADRAARALRSSLAERMQETAKQTQTAVCPVCLFQRMPGTFEKCGNCQQEEKRQAWIEAKNAAIQEQYERDEKIRAKLGEMAGKNIQK